MNVYACTDFRGRYPVGSCAIIMATNVEEARKLLLAQLTLAGLSHDPGHVPQMIRLRRTKPAVVILLDGDD